MPDDRNLSVQYYANFLNAAWNANRQPPAWPLLGVWAEIAGDEFQQLLSTVRTRNSGSRPKTSPNSPASFVPTSPS